MNDSGLVSGSERGGSPKCTHYEKTCRNTSQLNELTKTIAKVIEPRFSKHVLKSSISNILCRDCVLFDRSLSGFSEEGKIICSLYTSILFKLFRVISQ